MAALFIAILAVSVVIAVITHSPSIKGAAGEKRVNSALSKRLNIDQYRLFHDLILPDGDTTTQIDHIIVSPFGVFVVETKNMKGWIFGRANQARWTQVLHSKKYAFQNPVRQNYKHIKSVEKALGIATRKIHGVVAFVGSAVPKTDMPVGVVWGVRALVDHIESKRDVLIEPDELQKCLTAICSISIQPTTQDRLEHVRSVRSRLAMDLHGKGRSEARRPREKCPQCGARMADRRNRKSGERFLGCSRFPDCRATRKLS